MSTEVDPAQRIINDFTRGMQAGRILQQVSTGGQLASCTTRLDVDITVLTFESRRVGGKSRQVPLADIDQIAVGEETDIPSEVRLPPLHELCVTLVVKGEALAFRFADVEERDTFAFCLAMFVDERRNDDVDDEVLSQALESVGHGKAAGSKQSDGQLEDIWAPKKTKNASGSKASDGKELTEAQKLVKKFVEKIVKGRALSMLSPKGVSIECLVRMDKDLSSMSIGLAGRKDAKQRLVKLIDVDQVSVGAELRGEIEQPIDDSCVTLVLCTGQAISFRFSEVEDRDTFAMCMAIFVDGNRKKAAKKKGRR